MKPLALLLPMAMIWLPACSALEVGLCFAEQGGGPSLPRSAALAYAVVTRAIMHVNTRDCALLAKDCESLLRLPGMGKLLAGSLLLRQAWFPVRALPCLFSAPWKTAGARSCVRGCDVQRIG